MEEKIDTEMNSGKRMRTRVRGEKEEISGRKTKS